MTSVSFPRFPDFQPLAVEHQDLIRPRLWDYQPQTSELSFTNLFIWRRPHGLSWCMAGDHLLFLSRSPKGEVQAWPPVGPPPRLPLVRRLLEWLKEEQGQPAPVLTRADARLAQELAEAPEFEVSPQREHFDYLYATADLIHLAGRRFHDKRNHLNAFRRAYRFAYAPMTELHLPACRELAEAWCRLRRCDEDLSLAGEWEAVREALTYFTALGLTGGVLLIEGRVAAFTLGELLNRETVVIHIEKADPEIKGAYTAINQQFLEHAWPQVPFVNREQDLGEPGLRTAKLSYNPVRLVEKFQVRLKGEPRPGGPR